MSRESRRAIATKFVESVKAETVCAHCGAQPIEWFHPDHPKKPNSRVSSLRANGASIPRITAEMERSTPLCRACRMKEDGRLEALQTARPRQKGEVYVEPQPCSDCGKMTKPMRRGRCNNCYIKHMEIR